MFNDSPFSSLSDFARVLIKALVVVAVVNGLLLVTGFNPVRELVKLNAWGLFGGRERLLYPSDLPNGQLTVEAQLATHAVHYQPKAADEFRVLVLGESGIAGWGLEDDETISAQLTDLDIEVGGRQVVAYNLAYPQPSAPRDAVVLDAAMRYDPDLIIWFMTAASLDNSEDVTGANRVFFNVNRNRVEALVDDYPQLEGWMQAKGDLLLDDPAVSDQYIGITNQELLPIWLNSLLYPFTAPDLAQTDIRVGQLPVPDDVRYPPDHPGFTEIPNETWDFLEVGCQRAVDGGVDLILINRPTLVGEGGASEENYNSLYSRAVYDRYREALSTYTTENGIAYADLWNIIPPENYTDTPLHADAAGYGILAAEISEILRDGEWVSTCGE